MTVCHFCEKLTALEQYTSEDARREWRRILNAVESGEAVGITRYGKPLAVVVPADWFEQAKALIEATGKEPGHERAGSTQGTV